LNNFSSKNLKILIDKSEYTLSVLHKDSLLIVYPCVFGFEPVADKMKEGDGATPEGEFGIRSMYPHKSWSYFIWIDYPNEESWRRFRKRKADGTIEQSATIGGEVGIHGVPGSADEMIADKTNWTLGCISLTTADITDLYKSISTSTKIEIVP
jgi:murein L,D-transpeptidase YafK